jgi:hypothetical protein
MEETQQTRTFSILRLNWLSVLGLVVMVCSVFSFLFLCSLDFFSPHSNPYLGILAYLIAPGFLFLGGSLVVAGWFLQRWSIRRGKPLPTKWMFDLTQNRGRHNFTILCMIVTGLLFVSAAASYQTYHYSESVQFCGQACHTPMEPEFTAYQHSPHARVACTECHVGHGLSSYVQAKLSGVHQLYAVAVNDFPRPIKTRKGLRPAQDTCEQCHWPEKFVGNLQKTSSHYLSDKTNTPYTIRLLLKVGGADPTRGPVGGIHWHMSVQNKIEFISTDKEHQVIPWVRLTNPQGGVKEFVSPDFKGEVDKSQIHRMDCMDCHNRPSHNFKSPNDAVDLALTIGSLDQSIPEIKKTAVTLLAAKYNNKNEAFREIAKGMEDKYRDQPRLSEMIACVQNLYKLNFFPEMKSDWRQYPDNIGHKDWPGCFRCHDGEHMTSDKKQMIKANDCNACHIILSQGNGAQLTKLESSGLSFDHPGGDISGNSKCNDCHTGGP